MKVVWKFELLHIPRVEQKRWMPIGATILDLQVQDGQPVFWALVDPTMSQEERIFLTVGTGKSTDESLRVGCVYVGTYQLGSVVGHVFEVKATLKIHER